MKHAYHRTKPKRSIKKPTDESLDLPFNETSEKETASVVARQVLEDVRRETTAQEQTKSIAKVPAYVETYLSDFDSIDHLSDALMQNVINGLDEFGQAYYRDLVELMMGEGHKLARELAEKTALKLALKHSVGSGKYGHQIQH